jgi:hypothetical protein
MELIHLFIFGTMMLILAYLAFKNAGGVTQIVGASSTGIANYSKTLQGR